MPYVLLFTHRQINATGIYEMLIVDRDSGIGTQQTNQWVLSAV
jgi:hypothetical protein